MEVHHDRLRAREANRPGGEMKRVLVPLAQGFEEIEAVTVVDVLRRAGIAVDIAGLDDAPVRGSRGIYVLSDASLEDCPAGDYDMIVLPGGAEGADRLGRDPRIRRLLEEFQERKLHIAAICAAPVVLSDLGLSRGHRMTSHPTVAENVVAGEYCEQRVVADGKITTSRAAGTAMEFALRLVETLAGKERMEEVRQGLMARL